MLPIPSNRGAITLPRHSARPVQGSDDASVRWKTSKHACPLVLLESEQKFQARMPGLCEPDYVNRTIEISVEFSDALRFGRSRAYTFPLRQTPPFQRLPTRLMKKAGGLTKSNGDWHCASRLPGLVSRAVAGRSPLLIPRLALSMSVSPIGRGQSARSSLRRCGTSDSFGRQSRCSG